MGNKRKYDTEEEIQRKIRKLQKKLSKRFRRRIEDSDDDELNHDANGEEITTEVEVHALEDDIVQQASPRCSLSRSASPHPESLSKSIQDPELPVVPKSPIADQDVTIPLELDGSGEKELDDEILQLLGDAPATENSLGPPIHKDVANRWQEILAKGLSKEIRDQIMQQYQTPSNCDLLLAPTLNPEVKAAIRDVLIKRDSSLMYKQKQLGVALSALASAVDSILSNEISKQKILKPVSDACRILCDIHFSETRTRRHFVITSINTELKDSLVNTTRNNQLFGDNVTEKIKTAQSIQKSGQALKNLPKTGQPYYNNNTFNRNRLNSKPQHRKNDNKATNDAARGRAPQRLPQRPPQRPPRPGPSAAFRPPPRPRSPPRRTARQ